MFSGCPGSSGISGTPTLKLKNCPECEAELEMFSSEMTTRCPRCGFVAYNDTQTCLLWCKYAKDCVGEEVYNQYMAHWKREELPPQGTDTPPSDEPPEQEMSS